jgi:hypothetical protein
MADLQTETMQWCYSMLLSGRLGTEWLALQLGRRSNSQEAEEAEAGCMAPL